MGQIAQNLVKQKDEKQPEMMMEFKDAKIQITNTLKISGNA